MKEAFKPAWTYALAMAVGFYKAFVMQSLWNWFAVPAFHLEPISYWLMYGLYILFTLIYPSEENSENQRWDRLFKTLALCVPESQQDAVSELLQTQIDNAWFEMGMMVFGKFFSITTCLMIGWAIHTFLI